MIHLTAQMVKAVVSITAMMLGKVTYSNMIFLHHPSQSAPSIDERIFSNASTVLYILLWSKQYVSPVRASSPHPSMVHSLILILLFFVAVGEELLRVVVEASPAVGAFPAHSIPTLL